MKCPFNDLKDCELYDCPACICDYEVESIGDYTGVHTYKKYHFVSCKLLDAIVSNTKTKKRKKKSKDKGEEYTEND